MMGVRAVARVKQGFQRGDLAGPGTAVGRNHNASVGTSMMKMMVKIKMTKRREGVAVGLIVRVGK